MADITMYNISDLASMTTPQLTDLLVEARGTASYKLLISDLAKAVVETYAASSLGGSARSVKAAIDSLNSSTSRIKSLVDISVESAESILDGITAVYNQATAETNKLQIGFFSVSGVGRFVALIQKNSANYGTALTFGYGAVYKIYKITCTNGTMSGLSEVVFSPVS